ncbi:hypothetical protein EUZ85_16635 [Hahella sp. KA22]|uniref:hypothetical protein n=1 Tax=Hahella sp. KA22 TaxID=1628392 RepID=UPI000FDF0626|nr:hypothetical protein [Hahella sp. KA22]AZZ92264.1 hypothetical protein ENC22_14070 [Hahella sp. KA22]QAY55635.1 hypothetical protein EUZ85_16635 [Hahella sp. KA22]
MKTRSIALVSVLALLTGCGGGGGGSSSGNGSTANNTISAYEFSLARQAYAITYVPLADARLYSFYSVELKDNKLPGILDGAKTVTCPKGGYYTIEFKSLKEKTSTFTQKFSNCSMDYGVMDTITYVSGSRDFSLTLPEGDALELTTESVNDDVKVSLEGLPLEYSGTITTKVSRTNEAGSYPFKMDVTLGGNVTVLAEAFFTLNEMHKSFAPVQLTIKPNAILPNIMKVKTNGSIMLESLSIKQVLVFSGVKEGETGISGVERDTLFEMDRGRVVFITNKDLGGQSVVTRLNDHFNDF